MPTVPQVTAEGLEVATIADLREQMGTDWRGEFGQSMDVSDASPDGQFMGVYAEPLAKLNELLEVLAFAHDPNRVSGSLLRAVCALTGTVPLPASFSTVTLAAVGTATTVIPALRLFSVVSTGLQFTNDEPATIVAVTAWAASTGYTLGQRRSNAGNVYQVITAGTSAGSGGPTTEVADITDNTVHWRFLGTGNGAVDFEVRGTEVGPRVAVAGDLTGIDTPLGGLDSVVNLLDAVVGRDEMTDPQLRAKRQLELAKPGTGTAAAIEDAALQVGIGTSNAVTAATAFLNTSDVTDVDGVPPHAVELLVEGGLDQDIWDMLRLNVPAGIVTHGTEVGTSIDSKGRSQTMRFSRTGEILVAVSVTLIKDPNTYPADGDAQIKLAIVTDGNARGDGVNIVASKIIASVNSVPGVLEISMPLIAIDPATPTVSTTIPVSLRQKGVYDTTRVTVITSDGVP